MSPDVASGTPEPKRRKTDHARFDPRSNLYRDLISLVIAAGVCYVIFFALPAETKRNTDALCTLRGNLEKRGQQSNDFLRQFPNGVPGISRAVIVKSVRDTRQTIHALSGLKC